MLKRILLLVILGCAALVAAVDYADKANWVICDDAPAGKDQSFDVFYVYPTLFASRDKELMDWSDPKLARKTVGFAKAQTTELFKEHTQIFATAVNGEGVPECRAEGFTVRNVRVFAPYVRQLEYGRILKITEDMPIERTELRYGFKDTADAFKYYLEHHNGGRPYILLGHSQGAIDLYILMKNTPAIAVERGFVAAYLPGLPRVTKTRFERDFSGRGIAPAADAGSPGALIVWNTQSPTAQNPLFTGPNVLCVNPLNWRTDATPAAKEENIEAFFYNYRTGGARRVAHFCGAAVDPAKGALIVDLPALSKFDARGFMGAGVFHMNDIWFFAGNLRDNAVLRVRNWRTRYPGRP